MTRAQVHREAIAVTEQQIAAALRGLRILCGMDGDYARDQNGVGFNSADTHIGHSLAKCFRLSSKQAVLAIRLVTKYKRQLPEDVVLEAWSRSGMKCAGRAGKS
jgi:hypothetical protein